MSTDPHAHDETAHAEQAPDAANANAPLSPDQLMQAATARIAELEAELAEMKDRWLRAEAETSNVRARGRREAEDARQYAVQKFATDIVEAAENLNRGIDALPPATDGEPDVLIKVRDGLAGIERGFTGVLERNGIKKEDPVGQAFDPNLHQAMAEQESEVHPAGTVMHAWTACWTLHGRLLKPAMVVVAKAPIAELGTTLNAKA
ncbi:MAG: nucleotide exchange factor GrpE [Acetobacteraceae bacterium]|nr:nucleotide exchange factor GrpE [Acetobacteraceae bacterium]